MPGARRPKARPRPGNGWRLDQGFRWSGIPGASPA
ncbi:hypothetical protein chiPu_0022415, partial [Chiloscyllium punctatum]|nr:hypothetical protein [Chiloscyllium punctatum]